MAEFTYNFIVSYLGNGDGAGDPLGSIIGGTLDDGEGDGVFDAGGTGDEITSRTIATDAPSTGVYLGTTIIDGQEWPVFYHSSDNESIVYLNIPDTSNPPTPYPTTLDVLEDDPFDAPCFLSGTRIATPVGETAVEALRIGDLVLTADGRSVPVRWVGRQTVACAFKTADRLAPVRVGAGALGNGLPLRDLVLTADHALSLDGLLITAGALVNDATITGVPVSDFGDRYTVYHVETADHDLILAEGTPAETFINYVGRQAFDNYDEFVSLYGDAVPIAEMHAPRIASAAQVPAAIRARLASACAA